MLGVRAVPPSLRIKTLLHTLEQIRLHNPVVRAFENLIFVDDLAQIDLVAQQVEQRPAAERESTRSATRRKDALFGIDPLACKFALQSMN